MRTKFFCYAVLAVLLVLAGGKVAAQVDNFAPEDDVLNGTAADEGAVSGDGGNLFVRNETVLDFAVFAGKVEKGVFLGKVSGYAITQFDLSKIPDLPQKGSFILRATPLDLYMSGRPLSDGDVLFSALVFYDMGNPEKKAVVNIPFFIDTERVFSILVSNLSPFVIEIRLNDSGGSAIAALAPDEKTRKIYLKPNPTGIPYRIFPVYVDGMGNQIFNTESYGSRRVEPADYRDGSSIYILVFPGPSYAEVSLTPGIQLLNE